MPSPRGQAQRIARLLLVLVVLAVAAGCSSGSSSQSSGPVLNSGRYVALGDSYSAGEGNPPFYDGTATGADNSHRSSAAYSQVMRTLFGSQAPLASVDDFRASSGARIADMYNAGHNSEPAQLDALGGGPVSLVTLTMGGNDLGFAGIASACVLNRHEPCQAQQNSVAQEALAAIDGTRSEHGQYTLLQLYRDIRQRVGKKARIVVLGYPHLFPNQADWPGDCDHFRHDDLDWFNGLVDQLNNEIRSNLTDAHVGGEFVDITSAFSAHALCPSNTDANRTFLIPVMFGSRSILFNRSYLLHPNANGQQAYAKALYAQLLKQPPNPDD